MFDTDRHISTGLRYHGLQFSSSLWLTWRLRSPPSLPFIHWGSDKIITFWDFLLFDVKNATQWNVTTSSFQSWRQYFPSVCFQPKGGMVVLETGCWCVVDLIYGTIWQVGNDTQKSTFLTNIAFKLILKLLLKKKKKKRHFVSKIVT